MSDHKHDQSFIVRIQHGYEEPLTDTELESELDDLYPSARIDVDVHLDSDEPTDNLQTT